MATLHNLCNLLSLIISLGTKDNSFPSKFSRSMHHASAKCNCMVYLYYRVYTIKLLLRIVFFFFGDFCPGESLPFAFGICCGYVNWLRIQCYPLIG